MTTPLSTEALVAFVHKVLSEGQLHYRDFAWRQTRDPYAILLSEIMLQQTQVARVSKYYDNWLKTFPSIDALAATDTASVLEAWQGLGYNRRGLALKRLADQVSAQRAGILPESYEELLQLPGVGPATAAGVMAFAHNVSAAYLETNVRSVVLHEIYADSDEVCDREVMAVVKLAAEYVHTSSTIDARRWNYALLDYGAWLKKNHVNPSRRSKQHTRQSKFEGSFRQKRAQLLRAILLAPDISAAELAQHCKLEIEDVEQALDALTREGFIEIADNRYRIKN